VGRFGGFAKDAGAQLAEARERAAKKGLAPAQVINKAVPGAVYIADDDAIRIPDEEVPGAPPRTMHETRRVVIVQARAFCAAERPRSVLVVPCTSSQAAAARYDFDIPSDEEAFTKAGIVAQTSLVQPILKSRLVTCVGQLRPETLAELQKRVLLVLGIEPQVAGLPPRA
jgi:mRNA-degrading endonuclease toxin of MazEF toxin-antitoxin module